MSKIRGSKCVFLRSGESSFSMPGPVYRISSFCLSRVDPWRGGLVKLAFHESQPRVPTAGTLPMSADLLFSIEPGESSWTVNGPTPDGATHVVPSPLADSSFLWQLSELRTYSNGALPSGEERSKRIERDLAGLARQISDRITSLLLSEAARPTMIRRLNQVHLGRTRLTIQVGDRGFLGDQVLALPWELVAPEPGFFPVRQGLLEVVRESVVNG